MSEIQQAAERLEENICRRKTLGEKIARSLFTSGAPVRNGRQPIADRLVLSKGGQDLGSWSEECMADQIDKLLRAARRTKGKPCKST